MRRGKIYSIDSKSGCLQYHRYDGWSGWGFEVDYNNITDYFILSGWKDIESPEPMYVWLIHRDEIIRGKKFWERNGITNKIRYMLYLKKYEIENYKIGTDKL